MKRKSRVTFGPGAASLILIVVILSMSVLGMLALMNARNDIKLSDRSIAVVEAGYALNDKAERNRILAKLQTPQRQKFPAKMDDRSRHDQREPDHHQRFAEIMRHENNPFTVRMLSVLRHYIPQSRQRTG